MEARILKILIILYAKNVKVMPSYATSGTADNDLRIPGNVSVNIHLLGIES